MANYKTTAIVLKTYDFKDFDKIVVMYSKEKGIIRAIAKGIKRHKSRLGAKLEPLNVAYLEMFKGKNLDVVNQCELVESFKNIRKDFQKITFALYFSELTMTFGIEDDPQAENHFNFLVDSLKTLDKANNENDFIHGIVDFQYKAISQAGYAPMFNLCSSCNADEINKGNLFFSPKSGSIICHTCGCKSSEFIELDSKLYNYLSGFMYNCVNIENIEHATLMSAHSLLFEYINQKTNYKLKSSKLIETLCLS